MAYKLITLEEQKFIPSFDRDNKLDPLTVYYKPLNKQTYDAYVGGVRLSNPDKERTVRYDASEANKLLWDSSVVKIENVVSKENLTPHTLFTKEELNYFYNNASAALLNEIINEIFGKSTLTGNETKNSELAQDFTN